MSRVAVIVFPGSNCDSDALHALNSIDGVSAELVWHEEHSLIGFDAVVLPGGFAYGDYLRCGAIARFSPIMQSVVAFANDGGPVLGICNGFQVLCEAGLLPGALVRNLSVRFVCKPVYLRVESPLFGEVGDVLHIPIAHGEGRYVCDETTPIVALRYVSPTGEIDDEWNPNGSTDAIAGVTNAGGNILGMMPHPERACDPLLGSDDGRRILQSFIHQRAPVSV